MTNVYQGQKWPVCVFFINKLSWIGSTSVQVRLIFGSNRNNILQKTLVVLHFKQFLGVVDL